MKASQLRRKKRRIIGLGKFSSGVSDLGSNKKHLGGRGNPKRDRDLKRTTVSLDDEAFLLVRRYAADRSQALGKAASDLVLRAFAVPRPTRMVNGVQVFDLPPNSPRVTSKKVHELEPDR